MSLFSRTNSYHLLAPGHIATRACKCCYDHIASHLGLEHCVYQDVVLN